MTNKNDWDYGQQAQYYKYRPNYAENAIDKLCDYVKAKKNDSNYTVADVGAGTGNLTTLLLNRGLKCVAIEPTKEMMEIGQAITRKKNVTWIKGTGENTGLESNSIDWFTMGSSFNTTNRMSTLQEARRVLKSSGFFTCMWNHRDIDNDPIQKRIEKIIETIVPKYERGVRREGQADFILFSKLFNNVYYIEENQKIQRTIEEYIDAWKSVKNKYWDFDTKEGRNIFYKITKKVREEFKNLDKMELLYTTRIWTAKVLK